MTEKTSKQKKEPFFNKVFWISLVISFLIAAALSVTIGLIEYYSQKASGLTIVMLAIYTDAIALSGLLMALFFLLQYLSTKGAFDILAYSLKIVFYTIFRPSYRQHGFPATFYDYKVLKDSENRKPILAILFVSLIFICAGLILYLVYKTK